MSKLEPKFVDNIAEACFNLYSKIPRSGKPAENEWTVLSCIVKYNAAHQDIEVVSLGTGSKCVGAMKMSPRGDVLNDSHAEVFARRGFLLYLYENIEKALKHESSILNYINGRFELKNDIEFAFYSSQLPCGDASIIPKSENNELFGDILQPNKRKLEDSSQLESKKAKIKCDVHRTGAKCLPNTEQDLKESGIKYHTVGLVRTKPGRGDRTLSVSCSDKIAKWTYLGIQGALLSLVCIPIYIKQYIFGAGMPYSEETLHRAILKRNSNCSNLKPDVIPHFYQSSLQFQSIRTEGTVRPTAASIVWVKLNTPLFEVAVQGRKLGVTKKKASLPINSLCISKYNIYKRLLDVLKNNEIKNKLLNDVAVDTVPYNEMKKKATNYLERWSEVKQKFFKSWTVKPDLWDFCVSSNQ